MKTNSNKEIIEDDPNCAGCFHKKSFHNLKNGGCGRMHKLFSNSKLKPNVDCGRLWVCQCKKFVEYEEERK